MWIKQVHIIHCTKFPCCSKNVRALGVIRFHGETFSRVQFQSPFVFEKKEISWTEWRFSYFSCGGNNFKTLYFDETSPSSLCMRTLETFRKWNNSRPRSTANWRSNGALFRSRYDRTVSWPTNNRTSPAEKGFSPGRPQASTAAIRSKSSS